MFYYQLKQFDKALQTNNKLIQLRPTAHDLYLRSGILYTQLGDTTNARMSFTKGLTICNSVLDTMAKTNRDYVMLTTNQAIALIMLGDTAKANKILKTLYDNQPDDPDFDNVEKKYIQSLMNKSSKELIEQLSNPTNTAGNKRFGGSRGDDDIYSSFVLLSAVYPADVTQMDFL